MDAETIETGYWQTLKGEDPLPSDVLSEITMTLRSDGTIQCKHRTGEGRSFDGAVRDVERARDRLTFQLEERFTRCPFFQAVANDRAA